MTPLSHHPVRLAGSVLNRAHGHVCAFFRTQEEAYRVLLPFLTEGVERGDKVIHIADPQHRLNHLRRLQDAGVDVVATQSAGQLEVLSWDEAYLQDGHFDQHVMLTLVEEVLSRSRQQGFPMTRLTANMEWALQDLPGVQDLVEYEARANYVLPKYHDAVVWLYDLRRFGADVAMDILRTHPLVIIGESLHENAFYVPPDEFLRGWHARV